MDCFQSPCPTGSSSVTILRSSSSRLQKLLTGLSTALVLSGSINSAFGLQDGDALTPANSDARPIAADLFQFAPTEPEDLLRAARTTQRLDRVDDAKAFLRRFLELELPETDLRVVRELVGANELLALRMDRRLSPEGERILKLLNSAAASKQVTIEQVQEAATKIAADGFAGTDARADLLAAPDLAAGVLLKMTSESPEGRIAESLLSEHISIFQRPLLTVLQTEELDSATQVRALQLISQSADPAMADRVLRFQFSESPEVAIASRKAIRLLNPRLTDIDSRDAVTDYLIQRSQQLLKDASGRFTSLRPTSTMRDLKEEDPRVKAVRTASELLADAALISPENTQAKDLSLIAGLTAMQTTIDETVTTEALISSLESAMEVDASIAATELLKSLSTRTLSASDLESANPVLVTALKNADPRVRCAAALMAQHEPGFLVSASQVGRTLSSIRTGSEKPEAVVVTGEDRVLDDLKFTLEQAGFAVRTAESGPDGFEAAAQQMNCELYLLSAEAPTWPLAVSLANLRADIRTRYVPVIVFGPERFRPRVDELSKIYPGVWFTSQPLSTTVIFETRQSDQQFAKIRTSRSEIRLNVEQLDLPELLLPAKDREVLKAAIQ